jgi:hypothetical protein
LEGVSGECLQEYSATWPRGPASPQRRTRRPHLQLLSPGTPTSQQNTRRRVANAGGTTSKTCLTDCLSPRGGHQVLRECWQDYIWNAGGSNPQPGNRHGSVLPLLSRFFEMPCCECRWNYSLLSSWSRVRVPPVPNQGDRSSVVEHDVSPILVAAGHHL